MPGEPPQTGVWGGTDFYRRGGGSQTLGSSVGRQNEASLAEWSETYICGSRDLGFFCEFGSFGRVGPRRQAKRGYFRITRKPRFSYLACLSGTLGYFPGTTRVVPAISGYTSGVARVRS